MTTIVNTRSSLARVVGALLALAALLAAMVLTASPASAHARLEATSPKDGSTLTATPPEVMLGFNEPIQKSLSEVTVKAGSKDATQGALEIDGNKVYQPLRTSMAAGSYKVTYKVVSADGHPVSGSLSFSYDPPEGDDGAGADPSATTPSASSGSESTTSSGSASPTQGSSSDEASPSDSPTASGSSTATTPADGEVAPEEPGDTSATTSAADEDAQDPDDPDEDEGTSGWVWAIAAAVLIVLLAAIALFVKSRRHHDDDEDVTLEDWRE